MKFLKMLFEKFNSYFSQPYNTFWWDDLTTKGESAEEIDRRLDHERKHTHEKRKAAIRDDPDYMEKIDLDDLRHGRY